jgi:hypothetical protein
MAEHADEPLPRLPLLLAKRAAQVGQHEEPMREPALAELRGARLPPAFPAGKAEVGRARTVRREGLFQSERRRVESEETLGRTAQDPLPRAVHETQAPLVIEDEDRGLDLLHHLAQERRRVERAEALLAQRLPERVHLAEREAERVFGARGASGPDGVVALQEGGHHVRERLDRAHDALPETEHERAPKREHEPGDRPPDARRKIGGPEENHPECGSRQPREKSEEENTLLETEPYPAGRLRA